MPIRKTFILQSHSDMKLKVTATSPYDASQIFAEKLLQSNKTRKMQFSIKEITKGKKQNIYTYYAVKGGTRGSEKTHTQLTDIPEDLTIKVASKTDLESLRLFNMTNKSYRTQIKPFLTTNMYTNQFHIIDKNAGKIMDFYSITLNNIMNSSINIQFFDKFIHAFTIKNANEQSTYLYDVLFNYTDYSKTKLSLFVPQEGITKHFLSELKISTSIFKNLKPAYFNIDCRILQFLLSITDHNMKGHAKIIMKISLIKQLMIIMKNLYVNKLLKHYAYTSKYTQDERFDKIMEDVNFLIESYFFNEKFMRNDYVGAENFDIFFFYLYTVIVSAIIFNNDLFIDLSAKQKYSIKLGMIYDMIYYIKSIYKTKTFNHRQQYTILFLFNLYNFIEKDKYLNLFIRLILFQYINYLFENNIVTLDILYSDNILFIIDIISESLPLYLNELSTLEFDKIGLPNQQQINIEIKKNILLPLAKNLEVSL
jgi:hypothetical protein